MRKKIILLPAALVVVVAFAFSGRSFGKRSSSAPSIVGRSIVGPSIFGRSIVGRWNAAYGNQMTGHLVLRSNGTYEADFTGQQWKVGGHYKMQGNTITITDSVCGFGYWAKYNCTWYSDDSLRQTVVTDSCSGRKEDANGMVLVRVKM
jgi:hypothetical protein